MIHITETRVIELLKWDQVYEVVKVAMASVAENRSTQPGRTVMRLGDTPNLFFIMPGYLNSQLYGSLGCKLFTVCPDNPRRQTPLPIVQANILLLDHETGVMKAIVSGIEITNWRTVAASVVATKYIHGENSRKPNKILAIVGAGRLGKLHAIAFQHFFNFDETRIFNRTPKRAQDLIDELKNINNKKYIYCDSVEECVRNADVVVTATNASQTLVKFAWLKKGAHVNAIGVNPRTFELDNDTYRGSNVYIDYWVGAKNELNEIERLGVEFKGQIGDLITGTLSIPNTETTTVFQSLGMAVEDCAVANLIYNLHLRHTP